MSRRKYSVDAVAKQQRNSLKLIWIWFSFFVKFWAMVQTMYYYFYVRFISAQFFWKCTHLNISCLRQWNSARAFHRICFEVWLAICNFPERRESAIEKLPYLKNRQTILPPSFALYILRGVWVQYDFEFTPTGGHDCNGIKINQLPIKPFHRHLC